MKLVIHFIIIIIYYLDSLNIHSKKYWVVLTQMWVKYGQTEMLG